jgi:hypothetical protein
MLRCAAPMGCGGGHGLAGTAGLTPLSKNGLCKLRGRPAVKLRSTTQNEHPDSMHNQDDRELPSSILEVSRLYWER